MQPMSSTDKYYTIIFNGEVYNYVALRKDLKTLGVIFYTNSDTEVILKSYIVWGKDRVKKLEGIFSFAIYDKVQKVLLIARD